MQIGVETSRAVENKRVFVVDDDEISRAVLQFMLHDENETHDLPSLEEAYKKGEQGGLTWCCWACPLSKARDPNCSA